MKIEYPFYLKYALAIIVLIMCAGFFGGLSGCNKLVQVPEPVNTITTSETFSTEANATSAMVGIYSDMSWAGNNWSYANSATTLLAGLSADELNYFSYNNSDIYQFQQNNILTNNMTPYNRLWVPAYSDIYKANAVIEGLQASTGLSQDFKSQLTGEAKFIRAFCNFYLVNLFGDIPLVTTTSWAETTLMSRTPGDQVYQSIVSDLTDAQNLLSADYSISGGERTRVNKGAATALLARTYLYQKNWQGADSAASAVINNSTLYSLLGNLDSVFLANNGESILQLKTIDNYPWATFEGNQLIPPDTTSSPNYFLTNELLGSFEPGDNRRLNWVDSTDYSGTYYYFPFKYKIYVGVQDNLSEYYVVLRLAEQFLIRAEARINEATPNLPGAIADLNIVRQRAGLPVYSGATDAASIMDAIKHENQIEFFAEWGHRWLDLKRWGNAASMLTANKGFSVSNNSILYPIPQPELQTDPNLTQNPGY